MIGRRVNRRDALRSLAGVAGGLVLGHAYGSVADDYDVAEALTVERLSPRLAVVAGAGGNVVAARGSAGVALVDGGVAARSAELLELVRREMGAPRVDVLFNTHWHAECIGSNLTLGQAGAKIVAHENTRLWLGTVFQRPWDDVAVRAVAEGRTAERDVLYDGQRSRSATNPSSTATCCNRTRTATSTRSSPRRTCSSRAASCAPTAGR